MDYTSLLYDLHPDGVATITLNILPFAGVGVAKAVTQLGEPLGNGSVNLTFTFTVVNLGAVPLTNVQVRDDLVTTFPLPTTFRVLTTPATVVPVATGTLVFNNNFNGVNNTNLLAAGSSLSGFGFTSTETPDQLAALRTVGAFTDPGAISYAYEGAPLVGTPSIFTATAVTPEPGSLLLVLTGVVSVAAAVKRRVPLA